MSETAEWTSRVSGTSDIELRLKCAAQAKEIVSLKEELALWKPMTPEEAEAAYEAAESIPMQPEEIEARVNEIFARCEDPAYRPSEPEHIRMLQRVRFLERVNSELERKAARWDECERLSDAFTPTGDPKDYVWFFRVRGESFAAAIDAAIEAREKETTNQ